MAICGYCDLPYCQQHVATGGGRGAHCCDIGCQTSLHTRMNCQGTRAELKKCESCGFEFCQYHFVPVIGLWVPCGGHVCKGVTMGAGVLGDSMGDYLALVMKLASGPGAIGAEILAAASSAAIDQVIKTINSKASTQEITKVLESLKSFKENINAAKSNPIANMQKIIDLVGQAKQVISDAKALINTLT